MCVVRCLLGVHYLLCVGRCVLLFVCAAVGWLFFVRVLLCVVGYVLIVGRCLLLFFVRCVVFVVWCSVFVGCLLVVVFFVVC